MIYKYKIAFLAKKPTKQSPEWIPLWKFKDHVWSEYARQKFPDKTHGARVTRDVIKIDQLGSEYAIFTDATDLFTPAGNLYYNEENDVVVFFFVSLKLTQEQEGLILDLLQPNVDIYRNQVRAGSIKELAEKL